MAKKQKGEKIVLAYSGGLVWISQSKFLATWVVWAFGAVVLIAVFNRGHELAAGVETLGNKVSVFAIYITRQTTE